MAEALESRLFLSNHLIMISWLVHPYPHHPFRCLFFRVCVFHIYMDIFIYPSVSLDFPSALLKENTFTCKVLDSLFFNILKCKMHQESALIFSQINCCTDYHEVHWCHHHYDNIMTRTHSQLPSKRNCHLYLRIKCNTC